jgi:hypothetical protein
MPAGRDVPTVKAGIAKTPRGEIVRARKASAVLAGRKGAARQDVKRRRAVLTDRVAQRRAAGRDGLARRGSEPDAVLVLVLVLGEPEPRLTGRGLAARATGAAAITR